MSETGTRLLKSALNALHYSGAARALSPLTGGVGAVLMLHHVSPDQGRGGSDFNPNRILSITPEFLDTVVAGVVRAGFEPVTMDEAHARLSGAVPSRRPFVAFTFDDGYRDNRDHALPVMKRHGAPMTIYATSDFAEGTGFLWWLVLEDVVARRSRITLTLGDRNETLSCATTTEKWATFNRIYWQLRKMPEDAARAIVAELAEDSDIDIHAHCRRLCMSWSEIREMSAEPLVTFGAHTRTHRALAKLDAETARAEMAGSIADLEAELGRPCRHFCYPYGDEGSASAREFETAARLGMTTAVTTAKGIIRAADRKRLTALPRLSLNGDYQRLHYVMTLLSGLPFMMLDTASRIARGRPTEAATP